MNPKDLVGSKKAPLHLVPPAAVIGMADGLSVGGIKYGPGNWRAQPIENMTYVAASIRHLFAYMDGQDYSEDSAEVVGHPVHHIDHALAGLGILRDAIASGTVIDTRLLPGPAAAILREMDHSVKATPAVETLDEAGSKPLAVFIRGAKLLCGHRPYEVPITSGPNICGTLVHPAPRTALPNFNERCIATCSPFQRSRNDHALACPLY